MADFQQDIRYALRLFVKSPGATAIIVMALALGIGANTAIFSVVDAVLLRPLPYPDPDRLVMIWGNFTGIGLPDDRNRISAPEFFDIRDLNKSLASFAALSGRSFNLKTGNLPERIEGVAVTAGFFPTLGIRPHWGRFFRPGEDKPGDDRVVVLGHGLWQRRFAGDTSIVGQTLSIDGLPHLVVGIAPRGFQYPDDAEMWKPLAFTEETVRPNNRGSHGLQVIARIRPELTLEQARSDADLMTRRIIEQNPTYPYRNYQFRLIFSPLIEEMVGELRGALWLLLGAVGFVLLIACANVANLLLAKASAREREVAIRTALGASRGRLVRQLLTESTMLSLAGGILGLVLAQLGLRFLIRLGSLSFPRISAASVDLRVLAFTLAIAIATGLFFGLAPALQAYRVRHDSLKDGERGMSSGTGAQGLRRLLVVAEVALSLVLLIGAGLLLKSFYQLRQVDPGFRPEGALTARLSLLQIRYPEPAQARSFYIDMLARLARIPGVETVGAISALPLSGAGSSGTTTVDSPAVRSQELSPEADWRVVTPGLFSALGVQLIRGRDFNEQDSETAAPVAIVDETMANKYWPGEDAVGKRLKRGGRQSTNPWMTIVGVVRHVRFDSLEAQSRVELYWPHRQSNNRSMSLVLRTSRDPQNLATDLQRTVLAADPDQPVYSVRTMEDLLSDSIARRRFEMLVLAIFAGIALLLASVGIYGVISYTVTQRSHEMGIRIALGASRVSVLGLVMSQSLILALTGVALGVAGSFALTRLISTLLFNVEAYDPATFVAVPLLLIAVALVASLVPAHRATTVDPMVALRYE